MKPATIKTATVTVTITCTLAELHETIEQSMRIALAATGHRIVQADGSTDETKACEVGRNAAAALMAFVVDEA